MSSVKEKLKEMKERFAKGGQQPIAPAMYRKMRRSALYSSGMSNKERMEMLQKSLQAAGEDRKSTRTARQAGAALGAIGSLPIQIALSESGMLPEPKKAPAALKRLGLGALIGGGLGATLLGRLSERSRTFAEKASKDPAQVKAILQSRRRTGFMGRRRMKQEADRIRDLASAVKGKKPSNPFITIER